MNKKGFTLIELLAVILILGIIALIAIPQVTKIIEESKRGAFKTTVENLLRAAEQNCQVESLNGKEITKKYKFTNGKVDKTLNIKGDLPKDGTIIVDDSCNVSISVSDGTYLARKEYDSDKINMDKANLCVRAISLHTEECTSDICKEVGYTESGSKRTTTITYGNLGTKGEDMVSGDAFDCDINNDGIYDPETERFYYVSDYYNSSSKEENKFEKDKAVLIYYNNTSYDSNDNLVPDNTLVSKIAYYADGSENWHGPVTAVTKLPTREKWTNVNLITGTRAIVGKGGETSTSGGILPTAFNYSNYAARLLTTQELSAGCNNLVVGSNINGELDVCNYFLENTKYSSDLIEINGYFLETPLTVRSNDVWFVRSIMGRVDYCSASNNYNKGVRPVITLLKSNISY